MKQSYVKFFTFIPMCVNVNDSFPNRMCWIIITVIIFVFLAWFYTTLRDVSTK